MNTMARGFGVLLAGLLCWFAAATGGTATGAGAAAGEPRAAPPADLGPVGGFVENRGQWPATIRFAASAGGEWARVVAGGLEFGCGAASVGITPAAPAGTARGRAPTGTRCHFLRGGDPARSVRDCDVFAAVALPDVAPGVDLVLRRAAPGRAAAFAYDLWCAGDAALAAVEFRVAGAASLAVDAHSGELLLRLPAGELRQSAPVAFVSGRGGARPVECAFELRGADRFGFRVPAGAPADGLCIDPDLLWATCVGGTGTETGDAIAVAANGDVFVAGTTRSTDLPATPGALDGGYNGHNPLPFVVGDAWVARLAAADGALLWCTYLGGSENDSLVALGAVGGDPVVCGWTSSTDYPTTPGAFDTTHNGTGDGYQYSGGDVFVTRLAADGGSLVWSSLLGGALLEYPSSMAVAPDGEVAVAGHVHSPDFPTTPGALRAALLGSSDFFVARFAADGQSLVGSTYCGGGTGEEYVFALAIAPDGDVIAAGATDSSDLPVTPGAYDATFNGGSDHLADGFVARLDRQLTTLRWCTYLGTPANEYPRGIALHADGAMTLTGAIDGPGLPTTPGVFGPQPFGGRDGFVWRLAGDGATSPWATYVGGAGDDQLQRCVALGGGRIAAAGTSDSADVPLSRGSAGPSPSGGNDGWLVAIAGDGSAVDYGAAFGGPFGDYGGDVQRTPAGGLATIGILYWNGFVVTPAGLPPAGGGDAYVVAVAGLPQGMTRHGDPSGACSRGARIAARAGPFVGEPAFALSAGDVPAGSPAVVVLGAALLPGPVPLLGVDLWVDPGLLLELPFLVADAYGSARLPLPMPAQPSLVGAEVGAQFLWLDVCPALEFGASDAVRIVVQP